MEVGLTAFLLLSVFIGVSSFNIDASQPMVFDGAEDSFGQSVVQFSSGRSTWAVVSAPLQSDVSGQFGKLYKCRYGVSSCDAIRIPVLPDSKMSSFGMTLAASSERLVSCGIVPKKCSNFTYSQGLCYSLDQNFRSTRVTKEPDCLSRIEIVFLIDGSGSVSSDDFIKMKTFVREMINRLKGQDILFALMQYSNQFTLHFDFNEFHRSSNVDTLMNGIEKQDGQTYTPTAILKVVREVFVPKKGSRPWATKILIVITDGVTFGDSMPLPSVVDEADRHGIIRYAIGVGGAFTSSEATKELETIASSPKKQHVFKVGDFNALDGIKDNLQEKIFAIEGTQSKDDSSFKMEMAQIGSSAVFTQTSTVLGAVGAYDWSGGFFVYPRQGVMDPLFINASSGEADVRDWYLGYSLKVANMEGGTLYVSGAPRYQHRGKVMVFSPTGYIVQEMQGEQVGSYFGAELCTLDVNADGRTDLLLIAAPMHQAPQAGGIIHVYQRSRSSTVRFMPQKTLQGAPGNAVGRFGSSIADLGDLNGDSWADIAVGAPLENDHAGSVYIFHGDRIWINSQYSQRISGSRVSPGVKYFGRSISGGMDLNQDNLNDITVGAQGKAFILRSQPVLRVWASIKFTPKEIPLKKFECSGAGSASGIVSSAKICFKAASVTKDNLGPAVATVTYSLLLDSLRLKPRAAFESDRHSENESLTVRTAEQQVCKTFSIKLPVCVEDSLSPVVLMLDFAVTGDYFSRTNTLRPVLASDATTHLTVELPFEKNCGIDNRCDDLLKVSFNFSGLSVLAVGLSPSIDLTVSIQNDREDSYKTMVNFFYPSGLSYRKVTLLDANWKPLISCEGTIGSMEETTRNTSCRINHPIFKTGSKAIFVATFDVLPEVSWGGKLVIGVNATSDNGEQHNAESMYSAELPVQYGINILLRRMDEESVRYVNFTQKPQEERKLVRHVYQVENSGLWSLDVHVTFLIPVSLGSSQVWAAPGVTPRTGHESQCREVALTPGSADIENALSKQPTLDCAVAGCRKIQCEVHPLQRDAMLGFVIEGDVGNKWIPQTEWKKFSLVSAAKISYNRTRYIHIFTQSDSFLQAKMETTIEIYQEYNYLPIILGASMGGLVLLGLISAGLYKAGFFTRRYKQLMEVTDPSASPEALAAEDST